MRSAAVAVGLAVLLVAGSADAKERVQFIYQVAKVASADGVKAPTGQVAKGLASGITRAARIAGELPADAPDPKKHPQRFKKYLKKKGLRAYRVNLEIIEYQQSVEEHDERGHKRISVRIEVRLFGETVPDRVMAFAGKGSATVKLDVGKKVRPRDAEVANHDAIEVAIDQAIAESLRKLSMPPPSKRKRRRKK
jgi:hypothetical protein